MLLSKVVTTAAKEGLTPDTINVQQDSPLTFAAATLVANDPAGFVVSSVHSPVGGTVNLASGNITFTPTVKTGQAASFKYNATRGGTVLTSQVTVNITPLPLAEVLMYPTTALTNSAKSSHTPPTFASIFANWDRTAGNDYYPGGVGAAGEALAWQLLTSPDRVSCTLNTSDNVCFASPQLYSNFEFEAIVSSTSTDNDQIGLLIAFVNEAGVNHRLMAIRQPGGSVHANNGSPATAWNWGLQYHTVDTWAGTGSPALALPSMMVGTNDNWSVKGFCRLRVERQENMIYATCTDFYATLGAVPSVTNPATMLSIDLNDFAEFARFMPAAKEGYAAGSQNDATFQSTRFVGGLNTTQIFDIQTNQVWEYNFGTSAWVLLAGQTIQSVLGWPRQATNPETGVDFQINQTSTVVIP